MNSPIFIKKEAPFLTLRDWWKTGDADWVVNRKSQWNLLRDAVEITSSQRKGFANYFVYGEALPEIRSGVQLNSSGINGYMRFVLTPYSSAQEAAVLYSLMSSEDKEKALLGFLPKSSEVLCLPDAREKLFGLLRGSVFQRLR